MSRIPHKDILAQRQDAAAPFLFDEDELPLKPEWVQAVRDKRYEHTGARLLDDDVKVQRMVDLLILGNGVKKVATAMNVSPHCIRAARRVLVDQGKLAPFKERAVVKMEELIEDGIVKLHEAIESGKLHPNFMSSAVGIIFDKRALALGEPTTISVAGRTELKPETLSVQALNDWAAGLPGDAVSIGKAPKPAEIEAAAAPDASSDASQVPPDGAKAG